jgi:hypothetical protein
LVKKIPSKHKHDFVLRWDYKNVIKKNKKKMLKKLDLFVAIKKAQKKNMLKNFYFRVKTIAP